jgi:hypothetical protein
LIQTEESTQVSQEIVDTSIATSNREARIQGQRVSSPHSAHDCEDSGQVDTHAVHCIPKVRNKRPIGP